MSSLRGHSEAADTYLSAAHHPTLDQVLDDLLCSYLRHATGQGFPDSTVASAQLQKAAWLASLLAFSPDESHQNKAMAFGALAHLTRPADAVAQALCYTIQSRTGNVPSGQHLTEVVGDDGRLRKSLSPLLDIELGGARSLSECESVAGRFFGTRLQRKLWDELHSESPLVVSAPTSAGKSFVVRRRVEDCLLSCPQFTALFIVPSKALISQVSMSLGEAARSAGAQICTFYPAEMPESWGGRTVFVMTQERCLRLLDSALPDMRLDFIFVDEIQKLEEEGRGGLLEFVVHELRRHWPRAQVVLAGPFIRRPGDLASRLLGTSVTPLETKTSPVTQVIASVRPVRLQHLLQIGLHIGSEKRRDVVVQVDRAYLSRWKGNQGQALADAVRLLGGDSSCIVYAHRKDCAEEWALRLVQETPARATGHDDGRNDRVEELADFLSTEVHEEYSLVRAIRAGVGFHHAGVPEFVRSELEELFSDGSIRVLYCTPTLLEGVNLPAERMFVLNPSRGQDDMPAFEFRNLIGRAGRMGDHLCGLVFCIEVDDPWLERKMGEGYEKDIMPSTDKAIKESTSALAAYLRGDTVPAVAPNVRYTACLIRNRLMRGVDSLHEYLRGKGISNGEVGLLLAAAQAGMRDIRVPPALCAKNPTIDPVTQDRLFRCIESEGVRGWVVTANPRQSSFAPIETERRLPLSQRQSFYGQLEGLLERLDGLLGITDEIGTKHPQYSGGHSIRSLVNYAVPWVQGRPYSELVQKRIGYQRSSGHEPARAADSAVRYVMSLTSTDLSFILAKHLKVWADILHHFMTDEDADQWSTSLAMPSYMELGCCDPCALALISRGVPRSTAMLLSETVVPSEHKDRPVEWLQTNPGVDLRGIHRRFLERLGIWAPTTT